jgi:hypothetical protein
MCGISGVVLGFEAPDAVWLEAAGAEMKAAIGRSAIVKHMCKDKPDFDKLDKGNALATLQYRQMGRRLLGAADGGRR